MWVLKAIAWTGGIVLYLLIEGTPFYEQWYAPMASVAMSVILLAFTIAGIAKAVTYMRAYFLWRQAAKEVGDPSSLGDFRRMINDTLERALQRAKTTFGDDQEITSLGDDYVWGGSIARREVLEIEVPPIIRNFNRDAMVWCNEKMDEYSNAEQKMGVVTMAVIQHGDDPPELTWCTSKNICRDVALEMAKHLVNAYEQLEVDDDGS